MLKKTLLILFLTAANVFAGFSQSAGITTYCNPLDLNYQYNFEQLNEKISYRSGADPVIVNHRGEYFLFETIGGGWWHSKNLGNWEHVKADNLPYEEIVAPAAVSDGNTIYLFQSTFEQRPIFRLTNPLRGHLEIFNRWMPLMPNDVKGPWDPDIFYDADTKKWFMYFGSSNLYPLYGIELDFQNNLAYKGTPKELIRLDPQAHGWERFGQNHAGMIAPFIEGAFMTKHDGKFYLQYAAPGTEFNVYANGTYVADSPLGEFKYAPYNPISYKPGGFMTGAGHGNTFKDDFGNYWNTGTSWLGVNWDFERRIVMFPAGFDADEQMFSNTRFGDFPQRLPIGRRNRKDDSFAGWMLLSYRKPVTVSSTLENFSAANLTDENPRTFWVAQTNRAGENATIDLQKEFEVKALQINFTDYKSNIYRSDEKIYTQFKMYASTDNRKWNLIADLTKEKRDRPNAYIELPKSIRARYIKYEHAYVGAPNLAISDIRVFGKGFGGAPEVPANLKIERDRNDSRNAIITWDKIPNAVGYNILWGIGKDKLYQTYQIFADQPARLELRALNAGQDYFFAIEAFNENGVSETSEIVR